MNDVVVKRLKVGLFHFDGLDFLQKAVEINPDTPVIMISGHGNIETAVEAVKKGAYDFIQKPPDLNRPRVQFGDAEGSIVISSDDVVIVKVPEGE